MWKCIGDVLDEILLAIIFRVNPNHSRQVDEITRPLKSNPASLATLDDLLYLIYRIFVHLAHQVGKIRARLVIPPTAET